MIQHPLLAAGAFLFFRSIFQEGIRIDEGSSSSSSYAQSSSDAHWEYSTDYADGRGRGAKADGGGDAADGDMHDADETTRPTTRRRRLSFADEMGRPLTRPLEKVAEEEEEEEEKDENGEGGAGGEGGGAAAAPAPATAEEER